MSYVKVGIVTSLLGRSPLRVGIMCRGTVFEEWEASCIRQLLESGYVRLELLIVDDSVPRSAPQTLRKVMSKSNRILFLVYERFLLRRRTGHRINLSKSLSGVPALLCKTVKKGKFSEYFSESDIRAVREFNLDFIIRFAFGIIRGEILNAARYGVWSFHHDDEQRYRGVPPSFWEIYNGDAVTGAILQRLSDKLDAGVILKKGFLKTIHYSYAKNLDAIYSESARWPTQVCADIYNGSATYLNNPPIRTNAPIKKSPSNGEFLKFEAKLLRNVLRATFGHLFRHDLWNIGLVHAPIAIFLEPNLKREVRWLPQAVGNKGFLADPFGIQRGDKLMILCENFDYRTSKGIIANLQFIENSPPRLGEAIITEFHMSYPFLLRHRNKIYCIPETCGAREISLYEADASLGKWSRVATLIKNFGATDPTVFQHEGTWWLMCSCKGEDHNLYVWYAEDLFGPWKPHSNNPVKTDIRSARPAGTPFVHSGDLIRPAQDCSESYGGSIVLNRVTRLTAKEYCEEQVATIEPDADGPFPDGIHTVSAVGNMTLVDGKRHVFIGTEFNHRLPRLFRELMSYCGIKSDA